MADLTAATLAKRLASHGVALEGLTILDFGSGPGRVTNELKKLSNACRFFGSDIDKEAIEWARANLHDTATFDVNAALPPTKHASGFFDVVYSVSVFTHLDEATQEAWLKELARITKPGGTLIVSTHGARTLASCTPRELEALNTRGFEFRIGRKGSFKLDGLPDFYQTTFHTKDYVARVWSKYLEVVDHIEGGLLEHQDLVVLRRRTNVA